MKTKHLINATDLDKAEYDEIVKRYFIFLKKGIPNDMCKGRIVATLFFQPSTRTMNMFQSAMLRSGGGWIGINNLSTRQ